MSEIVPPQPLDTIAWVTVRLHSNGMVSTQGTIGDKAMALHLLDQAKDAIRGHVKDELIVVPNRDVPQAPRVPTRDLGDMSPSDRGEP